MQNFRTNLNDNARTKGTLTADAVLKFLHENKIPVLIENGGKYPRSYKGCGRGLMLILAVATLQGEKYGLFFLRLDHSSKQSPVAL